MILNVGCCGSSGSTFFNIILDRHPNIAGGPELNIFSKYILYTNFNHIKNNKKLIKRFGISGEPYYWHDRQLFTNLEGYNISEEEIWKWVDKVESLKGLANKVKNHIFEFTDSEIWLEKTPRNIFTSHAFLNQFTGGKFIHIIRDPRDVVLSLKKRGYTLLSAIERWMASVASVQNLKGRDDFFEVRYEDLIYEPEKTLENICDFLGIKFDMGYFSGQNYESLLRNSSGLDTWQLDPNEGFSSKSIGKFRKNHINLRKIYTAKLTREFSELINTKDFTLIELANSYGYNIENSRKVQSDFKNEIIPIQGSSLKNKIKYFIKSIFIDSNKKFISRVKY